MSQLMSAVSPSPSSLALTLKEKKIDTRTRIKALTASMQ